MQNKVLELTEATELLKRENMASHMSFIYSAVLSLPCTPLSQAPSTGTLFYEYFASGFFSSIFKLFFSNSFVSSSTSMPSDAVYYGFLIPRLTSVPPSPEFSPTPSSSELISIFPFEVKPSGDPNRPQISYIPWTKAELGIF